MRLLLQRGTQSCAIASFSHVCLQLSVGIHFTATVNGGEGAELSHCHKVLAAGSQHGKL